MSESHESLSKRFVPVVRNPGLDFRGGQIPKDWSAGNLFKSTMANAVNMLFPAGERFFVRSVRAFGDQIKDPVLLEQIKGFYGQEGRHAVEHERFFEVMKAQGYKVDEFLAFFERVAFELIEPPTSKNLRLSVTAAAEHFTAVMAENNLTNDLFAEANPTMRDLMDWHSVEELEHKAVAFDVFQQVDGRYSMRMLGMVFAALLLGGFWMAGFVALLLQCTPEERARIWRERLEATDDDVLRNVFLKGLSEYFRTDFHPNRKNTDHLLEKFFRRSKLTPPQPASASAGSSQAA